MKAPVKNIDDYMALQPEELKPKLEKIRQVIKSIVPEAEEVISYAMPAFKYHGMLVGFAAFKNHLGFYPWNGSTVDKFAEDLKDYGSTKGAIHLPWDKPIPEALVKKIVLSRIAENIEKEKLK